jgi:hypothetical protein
MDSIDLKKKTGKNATWGGKKLHSQLINILMVKLFIVKSILFKWWHKIWL